jgi:hypothetical protein
MKTTVHTNAVARFASKQCSIPYIPEVSSLKRLVFMLLLAIALPTIAFADSNPARDVNAAQTSAATATIVKANAVAQPTGVIRVPEPGILCLLGTGLLGLAVVMRRKLKAKESLNAALVESSGD